VEILVLAIKKKKQTYRNEISEIEVKIACLKYFNKEETWQLTAPTVKNNL
jgi:hypothetical protein